MPSLQPGPRYNKNHARNIKVALFDTDNTLVGNESPDVPTKRFKTAVDAARGSVMVGIASARPLAKVAHILDYVGAEGLSILCNGAQIIHNRDKSVVAEWPIDLQTCHDLLAYIRGLAVTYWVNDDGIDYFVSETDATQYEKQINMWDQNSTRVAVPGFRLSKPFIIVLHDIDDGQVADVQAFIHAHTDAQVTSLVAHEYKQQDDSYLYDVFIVHTRANKKDAFHEVARLQNLTTQEIAAVGDGRNDAVLVGGAGVGIAMGNSAAETLAVATYIAPDRDHEGAAIALEFILEHLT